MKFRHPGITGKLFLAILATRIVLLISTHWAARISFGRGFTDYTKRGNERRLTMLSDALSGQYAQHGSWAFLRNNGRFILQLLRTLERDNDDRSPPGHGMKPGPMEDQGPDGPPPDGSPDGPSDTPPPRPEMPPHGWRTMFWVVDQSGRVLVGPREHVPEGGTQRSIVVNGVEVGKVIALSVERLTHNTNINFDRQQEHTGWLTAALATLLAVLATFPLARGLLAPAKRLAEGTHKLAAGDFSTRVTVIDGDGFGRLAQGFNQFASILEHNRQMCRDLMADISHEPRTPLAVLRGELEAIQNRIRCSTLESIPSPQAEVATLTKLVGDLHQLSMPDEGALAYQKTSLDITTLLEVTAGAFRERFASRQLSIQALLPRQTMIFGDHSRLMQLFNNLLENSLRYTDSDGSLHITARRSGRMLVIDFVNSAPGVSDEQLVRLCEHFYRVEGSYNHASGGFGLGLTICLSIVVAHGGTPCADYSPFGGVSIKVELFLEHDLPRDV